MTENPANAREENDTRRDDPDTRREEAHTRDEPRETRRSLLRAAAGATLGGALSALSAEDAAAVRLTADPSSDDVAFEVDSRGRDRQGDGEQGDEAVFPHGIASGGPTPNGVLLWTRVDSDAHDGETPLAVEVAADDSFDEPAFRGTVPSAEFGSDRDYTATVDVDGELDPDTRYAYRFVHDGAASTVGQCRTLPAPDASPASLDLAIASCNHYLDGYFGAFAHVGEEDADFLLHLGDFIYEDAGDGVEGRSIDLPSGAEQATDLADYRHLYRTYRSDPNLRRALANHTMIHVWDDHEVVNDRWWNYDTNAPETYSHPRGDDPEFMRQLYVDAIRAYTEYVPARVTYEPSGGDGLAPDALHDEFRLYRSLGFGDLAELFLTDERLYRSPPPSTEDSGASTPIEDAVADPGRTMLGRDQRRWFREAVTQSNARWTLWGNEVLASAFRFVGDGDARVNADAWDGYRSERREILSGFGESGVENFLALTGDMHSYLAGYLLSDYGLGDDAADLTEDAESPSEDADRVGIEFMAPAISSDNLVESGQLPDTEAVVAGLQAVNPHVEWFDSHHWGYATVQITRDEAVYSAYAVDRERDSADVPKRLLRRYRVPAGSTEMERVDDGGEGG
ncbi:alkaline phosphatase D family protein [Halorussus litoreus]|uniref:alkaline phosphatase D family protein n=1 Tax=Halorussus litoreus TaxID=1710536 RepID=UPI000E241D17|nr:alkaline phosphatase D family protein [Halorussus litoreus]